VSSSYLIDYKRPVPYWLESEIRWCLDDGHYHPSAAERASVVAFLEKRGMSVAKNNVNRWLGASCVTRGERAPRPHVGRKRGGRIVRAGAGRADIFRWLESRPSPVCRVQHCSGKLRRDQNALSQKLPKKRCSPLVPAPTP